jgi:diacylglycerol kinase family enzyme
MDGRLGAMASSPTRIAVLINEYSGLNPRPDAGEKIQALFAAAGAAVRLERVRHGGDLAARARQAAGRSEVLVAAGGDGTVGSVAGVAVETNATFGVLPLGTLNHFARDAGIPLDLPEAVQTIVHGHVRDVDVGDLNGRIFVNNSSLGIYPRMVWERNVEQHHGRGKWTAFVIAMARTWRRYRMLVARMSIDQRVHVVRTPFIFVGNNEYLAEGFELGARGALDAGRLSIFVAPECGRFEILTLPLRAKANRLTADARFQRFLAEEATIELSRHHVSAAFDGEVAIVRTPLHFRIRRAALHVLVPGPSPS